MSKVNYPFEAMISGDANDDVDDDGAYDGAYNDDDDGNENYDNDDTHDIQTDNAKIRKSIRIIMNVPAKN